MITIPLTNKSNFYSLNLTGDYLRLYNACVDNLSRGVMTTTVDFTANPENDFNTGISAVIDAIFFGCPELFYVQQNVESSYTGNEVTLSFSNKYPNEDVNELWAKLDREINRIVQKVVVIGKDYDKIQRINKYLCARVKPVGGVEGRYGDAYGALILKEARCEGYCKAAQLILQRAEFYSIIACGEGLNGTDRQNHTWNIIQYKGQYYHFDFTWNASFTQEDIPGQIYMFLDDTTAFIEHFPSYPNYPQCVDASKTFWALHRGNIRYHSDLARMEIVPFKNSYLSIARFETMPTVQELNEEAFAWMADDLSAYSYARQLSYNYNERLHLVLFYFINS